VSTVSGYVQDPGQISHFYVHVRFLPRRLSVHVSIFYRNEIYTGHVRNKDEKLANPDRKWAGFAKSNQAENNGFGIAQALLRYLERQAENAGSVQLLSRLDRHQNR